MDYESTTPVIKTVFDVTSLNKIASEKLENRDNLYDELEEVNYEYHMFYLFNKINKKKHKISLGDNELKRRKIRKYFERNLKKAEYILDNIDENKEHAEQLIECTCNKFNDYPDEYIYIGRSFINPVSIIIGGYIKNDQTLIEQYFNKMNPPVTIEYRIKVYE